MSSYGDLEGVVVDTIVDLNVFLLEIQPRLKRYFRNRGVQEHDAEDCVQQCFLVLSRTTELHNATRSRLTAFLFACAYRVAYVQYRVQLRRNELLPLVARADSDERVGIDVESVGDASTLPANTVAPMDGRRVFVQVLRLCRSAHERRLLRSLISSWEELDMGDIDELPMAAEEKALLLRMFLRLESPAGAEAAESPQLPGRASTLRAGMSRAAQRAVVWQYWAINT